MRGEAVTDGVVAWLMATLDEAEREARAEQHDVTPDHYGMERCDLAISPALRHPGDDCTCGLVHRQAVVLAAVEVDREILAEHESRGPINEQWSWSREYPWCVRCSDADEGPTDWPCRTILLVASRYRHRPGYREEWKP